MTYEEAIKYFKNHIQSYCVTGVCKEAEELAIEALQKQVPMKPRTEDFGWVLRESCPVCDDSVDCGEIYCSYCGQRIDRSDEE